MNITDRTIANLREKISSIHRNTKLIREGNTLSSNGKHRLDKIEKLSLEIDEILRNI